MNFNFLSKTALFRGITPQEIERMASCMQATTKKYHRDDVIYYTGDTVSAIGLVLSGSISIESDDIWGNRSILDKLGAGQVFAETYACIHGEPLIVNVVANEDTEVLFLSTDNMFNVCCNACGFHNKLICNMLTISAQRSLNLSRRILHTSSKTIRGRLLSYLSYQSTRSKSHEFDIPFNRQQLADYLSVDRSTMSNELSKMQKDGLIKVDKNHFVLIDVDDV